MYNQVAQAYQRTQQTTANPRELEASLLIKAAARLQSVRDNWDNGRADLDEAITFNRKLWTILATSATRADNPLPQEVKTNVANMAVFIFSHSMRILSDPKPEKLTSLIFINANIAAGLRGSAG
ncbi:flagellar biosynthesis regulator FlaF [Chthonobacter rhizosphaerae]|uniref:flagellar biosynthesis regulator FlaF n=1 Tax=Chthonobacter rhizosphaerae TaxID=2735553 RepID=UPI0015EEBDFA|nr:flagellar biosynthesis regulator FlaF [Chthonobacter rhizosphaerae]